jgi:DNA adenine methylase
LQGAQFVKGDFASLLGASRRRDFVYCDPTYTVKHNNNGFLRYNERIFGWHDQERLARSAERARLRGVTVVVSNADHGAIEGLYPNFHVRRVTRMSRLAPSSSDRGHVTELLLVGRPDDLD